MAIYRYIVEAEYFNFDYDKWQTNPSVIKNVESFADSLDKEYSAEIDRLFDKLNTIEQKAESAETLDEGLKCYDEYFNSLQELAKYLNKIYDEITEKTKSFKSKGLMDNETYNIIIANMKIYKAGVFAIEAEVKFAKDNKDLLFDYDAYEESATDKTEKAIKKIKAFIKKSSRTVKAAISKTKTMFKSVISKFKSLVGKFKKKLK